MKILIIRFSSIGDIVLTTPVIRCVKTQVRDAELHYITKPRFREVVEANPHIDKLHELNENFIDTIKQLRKERFDFVIDLHHNQRTFLIKQALMTKSRSFDKLNIEKWLMVNLKVNQLKPVHIVNRYFDVVKSLGVEDDGKGLEYYIPEKEEMRLAELPEIYNSGYIGWVVGAAHNTKKFPAHKIISACEKIQKPVVLLGGKSDFSEGEKIARVHPGKFFNACGKLSLNQSASLVRQASVMVSNDTGLMHIAAAFQKPIISLWGNTIPEFGMYPYYGNTGRQPVILEVNGLSCRPCSKLGYSKCPKKHFKCMENIDENKIAELLNGSDL